MSVSGGSDIDDLGDSSQDDTENWTKAWSYESLSKPSLQNKGNDSEDKEQNASVPPLDKQKVRFSNTNASSILQSNTSSLGVVSRMQLNDHKAGMDGLDKDKINAIIFEASKGSRFYENEVRKEEQMNTRLQEQQQRLSQLGPQQIEEGLLAADKLLEELERSRDLSRSIVHVDMDMFYAAVEMRDDPSLKTKPMAVGGNSMLSTSNYIARKFGVRAAMPGFIAKKLCPNLILVPPNFEKYTEVSRQVRQIFADYDVNYSAMSLDEAYLDFTEHVTKRLTLSESDRSFPDVDENVSLCACRGKQQQLSQDKEIEQCTTCNKPVSSNGRRCVFGLDVCEAVREMRHRIHLTSGLTASAGIAPNTMIAKVCSDKNKPNGQYKVESTVESVMEFINDLPIRKVSGIGKVSERLLRGLGVETCKDLYLQRARIYHLYSNISFVGFMHTCRGIGSTSVERDDERKSISMERTFHELSKPEELYEKCTELCQSLCEDMEAEEIVGKTVTLKVKTINFEVRTRAKTLRNFTQSFEQISEAARNILKSEIASAASKPLRLRLMGVRMSNLTHVSELHKFKKNSITSYLQLKSFNTDESATDVSATVKQATINQEGCENEKSRNTGDGLKHVDESDLASEGPIICPVCNRVIKTTRVALINEHINFCLERSSACTETYKIGAQNLARVNEPSTSKSEPLSAMEFSTNEECCADKKEHSNVADNVGSLELCSIRPTENNETENPLKSCDPKSKVFKVRDADVGLPSSSNNCLPCDDKECPSQNTPGATESSSMSSVKRLRFGVIFKPLFTRPVKEEITLNADNTKTVLPSSCSMGTNPETVKHKTMQENETTLKSVILPARTVSNISEDSEKLLYEDSLSTPKFTASKISPNGNLPVSPHTNIMQNHEAIRSPKANKALSVSSSDNKSLSRQKKSPVKTPTKVGQGDISRFLSPSPRQKAPLHEISSGSNRLATMVDVKSDISITSPQSFSQNSGAIDSISVPNSESANNDNTLPPVNDKGLYVCPVCAMRVNATLSFFNKHIDNCLSKVAIKDMVEPRTACSLPSRPSGSKRSPSQSKTKSQKDPKRRRLDGQTSMTSFIATTRNDR